MSQNPSFEELEELSAEQGTDSTRRLEPEKKESGADDSKAASAVSGTIKQGDSSRSSGQLIADKYQLLEKLGSGGISSVYRVKHLHLGKTYALKLLHELKAESILRFQQEAKAASLLQHQNIVGIVDFGVFDGKPYMVMNCVEGETLWQYAKVNRPLDPKKSARIFGEICAALAHAHEKGVVHRDIKPSNIMISVDEDGVEHAVVVDFGIAKITTEQEGDFNSQLTRTGDIFGTPLYMSPEQCKGLAVDARSDIYSLACVMYEVLTGSPPFSGDSPYEIIHKQITEAPKPFSADLRSSPLVAKMEALILKAMAKSPDDRYQYMLEMSSALKAIELGAKSSAFSLASWNLAMARFRASDKQKTVFKLGIFFLVFLSVIFAGVLTLFPAEIDRLSKRINAENEIITRSKEVFTFKYDSGASLFRIKRSEIKTKLANIKQLAKFDGEISNRFVEVAKSIMVAADKVHDLRGLKRAITSDDPAGALSQLATLNARLDAIEYRLGEASNCWSDANLQSVNLSNWISRQIASEEKKLTFMKTTLVASKIMLAPSLVLLLVCIFMAFGSRRKEQTQLVPSLVQVQQDT